jgi:phosphatidylserine/phosphatidylglycerophosphate/cardiolipin synthase-like enzyme
MLSLAGCQRGPMPPVDIYFSPKGGATQAVVDALDATHASAYIQAYSFTSPPIAAAIIRAHERGVQVQVILDKSNLEEKRSKAADMFHHGIVPLIDSQHEIAHNKVMILDGEVVITGSFNFTKQAETSNAENLMVIHDKQIAARYMANWRDHEAHSDPYTGEEAAGESSGHARSKARRD